MLRSTSPYFKRITNQTGAIAILVGLLMVVFVGLAALAVDIGHLYLVRNELQNASDAGALAGARVLYNEDGTEINEGANATAYDAAVANMSEKTSVDVHWSGGNSGDIERGHWCFGTRTFTANDSTDPVDLWNVTPEELDTNLDFINAVRVRARRQDTPATSFFGRIFGYNHFILSAESVAYIGFAGTLTPAEADQPIAICQQSILDDEGRFNCVTGRMLNSGNDPSSHNTAAWTNFTQPCETANSNQMRSLICREGNPEPITLGNPMGTTNGVQDVTLRNLRDCWLNGLTDIDGDNIPETPVDSDGDGIPDQPWKITLPVIDCGEDMSIGNCMTVVGAVEINVLWITESGTGQVRLDQPGNFPIRMGSWTCTQPTNGATCWNEFTAYFGLQDWGGNPVGPPQHKSMYFHPDCTPHIPAGRTGGENFGILAKIPVLVK